MTKQLDALKAAVVTAFQAGLVELDPAGLVERALPPLPPKRARVRVIAAGKAATAMARGALARWGPRIEDALVVTVDSVRTATATAEALAEAKSGDSGSDAHRIAPAPLSADTGAERSAAPVRLQFAAHPVPDARSVKAAEEALRRARELGAQDLLVALISGGASSLLAAPPAGMTLAHKAELVAALLDGGTPIAEVNTVRRHLSRIKGGRLAIAAAPARVLTLIISDVIGGAPHDIGSGPAVADPTTLDEAARILALRAPDLDSPKLRALLSESLKDGPTSPGTSLLPRIRARILAEPDTLARLVATDLSTRAGLHARASASEQGDAASVVRRRIELARALAPGEAAIIACEPTVPLPPQRGRGGRAGWIALASMRELPADVVFLCAATDGVDGNSGAAGAIVTRDDASTADEAAIREALDTFNDAPLHRALGTSLEGGPTGHNLTDLHVLARLPT